MPVFAPAVALAIYPALRLARLPKAYDKLASVTRPARARIAQDVGPADSSPPPAGARFLGAVPSGPERSFAGPPRRRQPGRREVEDPADRGAETASGPLRAPLLRTPKFWPLRGITGDWRSVPA